MQAVTKHDKLFTYQVRIQIQNGRFHGLDAGLVAGVAQTQAKTRFDGFFGKCLKPHQVWVSLSNFTI